MSPYGSGTSGETYSPEEEERGGEDRLHNRHGSSSEPFHASPPAGPMVNLRDQPPAAPPPSSYTTRSPVKGARVQVIHAQEQRAKRTFSRAPIPDEVHQELEEAQVYRLWERLELSYLYRVKFRARLVSIWEKGDEISEEVDDEADQLEPLLGLMGSEIELVRKREAIRDRLNALNNEQNSEGERERLMAELDDLSEEVKDVLSGWVTRHSRPFLYGGVDYLEWIAHEETLQDGH